MHVANLMQLEQCKIDCLLGCLTGRRLADLAWAERSQAECSQSNSCLQQQAVKLCALADIIQKARLQLLHPLVHVQHFPAAPETPF